jgi:outer membrane receptor for ferrienterochelin and colicins
MKTLIWMAVFAVVLGFVGVTWAQDEKEAEVEAGKVVVTGTKTEKKLLDVPVRTEVITAEDILAKGALNLYEALEAFPGIRVEQQCSYCNFSQVRMQGLDAGHTQVLINSQPLFSGLAGVYGLQQVPTSSIDRIEVVKGAGSALYGSNAIAGVINIITKDPTEEPEMSTFLRFGEDNTNAYGLSASQRVKNMDMLLNVQKNTGGEIDENDDDITDRVKTDDISASVRLNMNELSGNDRVTFSGTVINESRQGGDLADDNFENPFAEGSEHIDTKRYETNLGYSKIFSMGNKVSLILAYSKHNRRATNDTFVGDYLGTHDDMYPPSNLLKPYIADENLYVADAYYSHPLLEGKNNVLAGVQFHRDEMDETGMYTIIEDVPNLNLKTGDAYMSESEKWANNIGFYLQDEYAVMDNLELVAGVRYDHHSSEDSFAGSGSVAALDIEPVEYSEGSINPRFSVMFKPITEATLRGSLGTGFRVPYGFSEDLHLCSGSPRVFKTSDLEPEKSLSFNVSADFVQETWEAGVSLFRTNLSRKIDLADAPDQYRRRGYDYVWENIGDAYTQGVELMFGIYLLDGLSVSFKGGFTDAQYLEDREDWLMSKSDYRQAWIDEYGEAEGAQLFNEWWPTYQEAADRHQYISRVPQTTAGVNLDYDISGWELALGVDFQGKLYIDYTFDDAVPAEIKETDPYATVNCKVAREIVDGVTLSLGANNLFDYIQEDKRTDDAAFMWAPYTGRVIYGGIEVAF